MIVRSIADLGEGWSRADAAPMPMPSEVLLAHPQFFEVRDTKNPFMAGHIGTVDRRKAITQWEALRDTFELCGMKTHVLDPLPECEDMVFTANPSFNGRGPDGRRICVPSRMAFASRQPEVEAHRRWFANSGYAIAELPETVSAFEGGGDAIWHPGRAIIWAASGPRSVQAAHEALSAIFDVPVFSLQLVDPRFYHLDTCFCPVNQRTAIIFSKAFSDASLPLIYHIFQDVIDVDEAEAEHFACNATALFGNTVVIQDGANRTIAQLAKRGIGARTVDTREFMKSGGSVFCMKAELR
ncbi:MAG TPA: arginine deiminase-related protein [Candidatus Baltobacteraceae bacterium]|nr:arginine deiminase-related protein [Candidatus Baltobacteraceae bacterium]